MKKFILAIAAAFMAASMVSAQDMAQATELYNNGATAISMKNWTEALDYFQKALEMGKTIGADADELVTNCKNAIPGVALEIAKDLIKDKKYEEAETKLAEVEKIATEYENAEVAERAKELVPQMWMQKGVDALKLKDFATAADGFLRHRHDRRQDRSSSGPGSWRPGQDRGGHRGFPARRLERRGG